MDALMRLLDLVRRELGADDARAEIGGRDPSGDREVFETLPTGHRIVVVFDAPPADLAQARAKLSALIASFAGFVDPPRVDASERAPGAYRNLREELDALVERTHARRAVVIDDRSPVVWGVSDGGSIELDIPLALQIADADALATESGLSLETLLAGNDELLGALDRDRRTRLRRMLSALREDAPELATSDRAGSLLLARAIAGARRAAEKPHAPHRDIFRAPDLAWLSRSFATIYRLVLIFDAQLSELHADAAMIHALPVVERLVLSLPPRDPVKQGARVMRMGRRLRPV